MGFAVECEAVRCVGWSEDQGRRDEMEDGWIFIDCFGGHKTSAFLGVYDGHGGRETVEYISQRLHENVLDQLRKAGVTYEQALKYAFKDTDEKLRNEGLHVLNVFLFAIDNRHGPSLHCICATAAIVQSGATACVCLIQEVRLLHLSAFHIFTSLE